MQIILEAGLLDRTTSTNPPNLQKDRFIDNVISGTNQLVELTGWLVGGILAITRTFRHLVRILGLHYIYSGCLGLPSGMVCVAINCPTESQTYYLLLFRLIKTFNDPLIGWNCISFTTFYIYQPFSSNRTNPHIFSYQK